jgi:hypothetical protein
LFSPWYSWKMAHQQIPKLKLRELSPLVNICPLNWLYLTL